MTVNRLVNTLACEYTVYLLADRHPEHNNSRIARADGAFTGL